MLSLPKRYAVYIPATPRPSSKIFEFFGISPSASPTSSLRQLLSGQGTGRSTPRDAVTPDIAYGPDGADHSRAEKGWSHTEAYRVHEEPMSKRCGRCFREFVRNFGAIWFLIPINAGLIGLLLRQILVHVLIPSDLVHATVDSPIVPSDPSDSAGSSSPSAPGHGIQIKAALLHTTHPFHGQMALQTISTIVFFVDLVLFTIFSFLFILRLIWFRQTAWREILGLGTRKSSSNSPYCLPVEGRDRQNNQNSLNYHDIHKNNPIGELSLWPLAWLTLVTFAVAIIPEREGSEPLSRNLTYAAYITWWIGAVWAILTTLLVFGTIILAGDRPPPETDEQPTLCHWTWKLPPNLLLPSITLSTLAVVGPLLVSDLLIPSSSPLSSPATKSGIAPPLSRAAILPVLIVSFGALGASLFLSAILFSALIFTHIFPSNPSPGSQQHVQNNINHNTPDERIDPRKYGLPRTGTPVHIIYHHENSPPTKPMTHSQPAHKVQKATRTKTISLLTTIFYFLSSISQSTAAIQLLGSTFSAIPGGDQDPTTSTTTPTPTPTPIPTPNSGATPGIAFLTDTSPSMLSIPCILLSLLLLGIAAMWFLLALGGFIYLGIRKQLRWNMGFGHGIVLSLATMGLSAVVFGAELNSGFFRVVACVFLGIVFVGFFVNLGFTVWFVVTGRYIESSRE